MKDAGTIAELRRRVAVAERAAHAANIKRNELEGHVRALAGTMRSALLVDGAINETEWRMRAFSQIKKAEQATEC